MIFKKKDEPKKPRYKATYKSLHSGNVKLFTVAEPKEALANFLQKGEGIWEVYMLTSIIPLSEEEQLKLDF